MKPKEQLVNVNDNYKNELLHLREREIFRNIHNKKLDKIEESSEKIDGNNLIYPIISTGKTIHFTKIYDPLTFLNKTKKGEITIEEAKESQKDFDKYLQNIWKKKITSNRKH